MTNRELVTKRAQPDARYNPGLETSADLRANSCNSCKAPNGPDNRHPLPNNPNGIASYQPRVATLRCFASLPWGSSPVICSNPESGCIHLSRATTVNSEPATIDQLA